MQVLEANLNMFRKELDIESKRLVIIAGDKESVPPLMLKK